MSCLHEKHCKHPTLRLGNRGVGETVIGCSDKVFHCESPSFIVYREVCVGLRAPTGVFLKENKTAARFLFLSPLNSGKGWIWFLNATTMGLYSGRLL